MASERALDQSLQPNEDPGFQLAIVQEDLRTNDVNIASIEEAWAQEPQNPVLKAAYERLAKREQLLLEERKIWAGASLQNNSWQAGFNSSVGFKELLKRMAAAAATGDMHDLLQFERNRVRSRPAVKQARASSHLHSEPQGKQLLMLCEAAEATESYGHGVSEWRGVNPPKYTEPWVRESPGKRKVAKSPGRTFRKREPQLPKFTNLSWDGVGYEVPIRLDSDEGIAAYVRAKLNLRADESCTEREPPGLDPSVSDDELNRGAQSIFSGYLKDQDYGAALSGGTKMSQQGNMTPGRSDNGAGVMPQLPFDIANYNPRNGYMEYPVLARQKPEMSDQNDRSLPQNTHLPSRYDDTPYSIHPP